MAEAGPLKHDAAQRIVERGQRQRLHERLDRRRKTFGRKEDAGENPHRHHRQIHEAGHAFNGAWARGDEQSQAAEGQGAKERNGREEEQRPPERHAEPEARRSSSAPASGIRKSTAT